MFTQETKGHENNSSSFTFPLTCKRKEGCLTLFLKEFFRPVSGTSNVPSELLLTAEITCPDWLLLHALTVAMPGPAGGEPVRTQALTLTGCL